MAACYFGAPLMIVSWGEILQRITEVLGIVVGNRMPLKTKLTKDF